MRNKAGPIRQRMHRITRPVRQGIAGRAGNRVNLTQEDSPCAPLIALFNLYCSGICPGWMRGWRIGNRRSPGAGLRSHGDPVDGADAPNRCPGVGPFSRHNAERRQAGRHGLHLHDQPRSGSAAYTQNYTSPVARCRARGIS